jgi:hypothetical protein
VKLFRKPRSKFYWYDFTVQGRRYRASTQETKSVRALKIASLKLASVIENTDPLPCKPIALAHLAERFLGWVDTARLEEMTTKFYRNGWRLLKATPVADTRVNEITGDCAERLQFPGSAANANCALRTLRRMLHKAEEWKMIGHAPKIKMMKERTPVPGRNAETSQPENCRAVDIPSDDADHQCVELQACNLPA